MADHLPADDEQLDLKKRARRRLIGAVVFATIAAVVLPMVMDAEPPPALPAIEFKIPAQTKGFVSPNVKNPSISEKTVVISPVAEPIAPVVAAPTGGAQTPVVVSETQVVKAVEPPPKAEAKSKSEGKVAPASAPTLSAQSVDAKRAQGILEGQTAKAGVDSPHVILIGAFANPGNVETLKKKIGEMGIKVYTEPLDTPQGKKIRVRAGPFPSRDAAEKAAARMKSIGVNGIVAAKS